MLGWATSKRIPGHDCDAHDGSRSLSSGLDCVLGVQREPVKSTKLNPTDASIWPSRTITSTSRRADGYTRPRAPMALNVQPMASVIQLPPSCAVSRLGSMSKNDRNGTSRGAPVVAENVSRKGLLRSKEALSLPLQRDQDSAKAMEMPGG